MPAPKTVILEAEDQGEETVVITQILKIEACNNEILRLMKKLKPIQL